MVLFSLLEGVCQQKQRTGRGKGKTRKNELVSSNRSSTSKLWSPWEIQLVWKAFSISQKRFILELSKWKFVIPRSFVHKAKTQAFFLRVSLEENRLAVAWGKKSVLGGSKTSNKGESHQHYEKVYWKSNLMDSLRNTAKNNIWELNEVVASDLHAYLTEKCKEEQ